MRTAPAKVSRDVQSYEVEVSFISRDAFRSLREVEGLKVANCYRAEVFPNDIPVDSKFSMLLEDFSPSSGWYQAPLLNYEEVKAGIGALARFHAFFWNGGVHNKLLSESASKEVQDLVWSVATHWAPSRQRPEMMDEIAEIWTANNYGDKDTGFGNGSEDHLRLGVSLQAVASTVASESHFLEGAHASHPHWTIIHGDAKAGNFFFRGKPSSAENPLEVGLIDFQWSGFGLGGVDLAYYIASSASIQALSSGYSGEMTLLRHYHDTLLTTVSELKSFGSVDVPLPSFEELVKQYNTGLLDVCRIAFAYHWGRIKASPQTFTTERSKMLGPCAYNKDSDVARWLVNRCNNLLKERGGKKRNRSGDVI